jgi:hypothetical protein
LELLENMIKYHTPGIPGGILGHGAMAAQQTLDLFILVRARMPQLEPKETSDMINAKPTGYKALAVATRRALRFAIMEGR